jgi:hypothetical protein
MIMIRNLIGDHFCEDAYGRDDHVHVSKSYETLYNLTRSLKFLENFKDHGIFKKIMKISHKILIRFLEKSYKYNISQENESGSCGKSIRYYKYSKILHDL